MCLCCFFPRRYISTLTVRAYLAAAKYLPSNVLPATQHQSAGFSSIAAHLHFTLTIKLKSSRWTYSFSAV